MKADQIVDRKNSSGSHLYLMEHKFRKFVISLLHTARCAEWSLLKAIEKSASHENIAWKISWALFKNTTGFQYNKSKKNNLWMFLVKIFHKALLLGSSLKQC